jgi:hypothetical protein
MFSLQKNSAQKSESILPLPLGKRILEQMSREILHAILSLSLAYFSTTASPVMHNEKERVVAAINR